MAGGQALPSSNFFHTNATDFNLGLSTSFFLLFPFLVFTKSQLLNLKVGRSCDPLLQKTY